MERIEIDKQDKLSLLKTHRTLLWVFLFFLLGFLIRIYNLGSHNLWFDELATLVILNRIRGLPNFMFHSYPNYYYYFLSKLLVMSFGTSEFVLRSVSMLFGVFSIPLIYKLGESFFNTKTGLVSAFILSISPMHIWYSQEARPYTLSTFMVMLSVYICILALKKNTFYLWAGFVVSSILTVYANYSAFFIIILVGSLFFLKSYRPLLKYYLLSLCPILFAFLSCWPIFFQQLSNIKNNFWIPKPQLNAIAITFENFNVGYNATPWIYFFTFLIFSLLFILGVQRWWKEKRIELIFLISVIFIPIISTFLISQIIPVYLDRQLMLFSPFYYIIIAAGLTRIKPPKLKTAAYLSISVPVLFCLHNYFSYRMPVPLYHHIGVHVKKPVKPAADYIKERLLEGDAVGYSGPSSVVDLPYYIPNLLRETKLVFNFIIKSKLWSYWRKMGEKKGYGRYIVYIGTYPARHAIILDKDGAFETLKRCKFKRLWLISSSWERNGILEQHAQAVREWMQAHYLILDRKEFDGIFVDLYCPKINSAEK